MRRVKSKPWIASCDASSRWDVGILSAVLVACLGVGCTEIRYVEVPVPGPAREIAAPCPAPLGDGDSKPMERSCRDTSSARMSTAQRLTGMIDAATEQQGRMAADGLGDRHPKMLILAQRIDALRAWQSCRLS